MKVKSADLIKLLDAVEKVVSSLDWLNQPKSSVIILRDDIENLRKCYSAIRPPKAKV